MVVDVKAKVFERDLECRRLGSGLCLALVDFTNAIVGHLLRTDNLVKCTRRVAMLTCGFQLFRSHALDRGIDFFKLAAAVKEYRTLTDSELGNIRAVDIRVLGCIGKLRQHEILHRHIVGD